MKITEETNRQIIVEITPDRKIVLNETQANELIEGLSKIVQPCKEPISSISSRIMERSLRERLYGIEQLLSRLEIKLGIPRRWEDPMPTMEDRSDEVVDRVDRLKKRIRDLIDEKNGDTLDGGNPGMCWLSYGRITKSWYRACHGPVPVSTTPHVPREVNCPHCGRLASVTISDLTAAKNDRHV